ADLGRQCDPHQPQARRIQQQPQQNRRNALTSDHDPPHVEAERTARLGGDRRMRADGEPYRSREPSRRDHRRQWSEWRFLQEPAEALSPDSLSAGAYLTASHSPDIRNTYSI